MNKFRMTPMAFSVSTAFVLMLLAASSLPAIVVTTTADENGTNPDACALREAVRAINDRASFGGCAFVSDETLIELGAETYELSLDLGVSDRVTIEKPLTISGHGPGQTTIERTGAFNDGLLFIVVNEPGTVLFEGLTFRGASGRFNSAVDFLARPGVELILRDTVFRDNVAESASAFRLQGGADSLVHLERVLFEDNTNFGGSGGGIGCIAAEEETIPSLRLVDVIFRNNEVESVFEAFGGGLVSAGCDLELENVTFDGNAAISTNGSSVGGGILVFGGDNPNTVALTNVTFFNNSADLAGGLGQSQFTSATLSVTLSSVTFADNVASDAGDHFFQDSGVTSLRNVLFGPSPGGGCDSNSTPALTLLGGNMDADGTCGVERTEANPGLAGALASLGGFTPVLPLSEGAAAIDAGTDIGCPAADQRAAVRPFDGDGDGESTCDAGAIEFSDTDLFFDGFESGDTGAWSSTIGAAL